jgi:hypothetical protein
VIEIAIILLAVAVAALLGFLVYRSIRTYDAGAHATFITTRNGDYYGALRAPITLWDPAVKVLKDKHAPDISIITHDVATNEYFEKSLVNRRTGEISLRVAVCAPRPFVSRTSDKKQLRVRCRVAFQLDIDRIQIPAQLQGFGALLAARVENLFDNAIGRYEDQEVFAKQSEIEDHVLRTLQDIEFPPDPTHPSGMPLGIKVYEAMFSYEAVSNATIHEGSGPSGAMTYALEHLDDLADMLEKANPETVKVVMQMLELQTRQNIVDMLCKSGGLVAFTAQELGLSERVVERAKSGVNIMKPPVAEQAPPASGPAPVEPANAPVAAAPVDSAAGYYAMSGPKRH